MKKETECLHAGYTPGNGDPRVIPIVQSTTYTFNSTEHIADIFDDPTKGLIYSRFANPTCDAVEKKIAALEGGVAAMLTSSGQAASLLSILNVCSAGDSFISTATIYGGTINLFGFTLKKLGIECIWVDANASDEEIQKAFKPNTKAFFGETLANPALQVCDIERLSNIAHKNNVPFIIDNTFPTPILCRPIEFGADIVIHSTTKYLAGNSTSMGGMIVDSGNFKWKDNPRFTDMNTPDESYHGVVFSEAFGPAAFIAKVRTLTLRDIGACQSPFNSWATMLGLETLHLRMERHCENAMKVAEFMEKHPAVEKVEYPALPSSPFYGLTKKYLPKGASAVFTFEIKGGREAGAKFCDNLKLLRIVANLGDTRSMVSHPATTTHSQLSDEQLEAAGISASTIRLSIGIESAEDIIADIAQALDASQK